MQNYEFLKTAIRIIAVVVLTAATSWILPPRPHNTALAQAGSGGGETPFGGRRVFTIICTCGSEQLLYIMDAATSSVLPLLYQPGQSILFMNYNTFGTYLLGTYQSGGTCRIQSGNSCTTINATGTLGSRPGTGTSK